jgi:hypothetical protein
MGSFRFRRSVRLAPGLRLNFNKRSVGISAGVRGARYSINSDGRRTRSVGIPGTGLSYRSQSGARRRYSSPNDPALLSPTRIIASLVGWVSIFFFLVVGLFEGHPDFGGTAAGIGFIAYVLLRLFRGVIDPLLIWLVDRRIANEASLVTDDEYQEPHASTLDKT